MRKWCRGRLVEFSFSFGDALELTTRKLEFFLASISPTPISNAPRVKRDLKIDLLRSTRDLLALAYQLAGNP
jgi:hypothetical protein